MSMSMKRKMRTPTPKRQPATGVTADMQGYANRLTDNDLWNLVNYIGSLSS